MKKNVQLINFIKYASMNVLGMISLSCYILADTFFISKGLGTYGLAALNLAIPIYSFVHGSGLMVGMGGATKFAIAKGKEDLEEGRKVFTNSFVMAVVIAFAFFILGVGLSQKITKAMGADDNIFYMTDIYIKTILMFSPAFMLNNLLQCFVRNDGDPRLSMIAMVSGSMSNIVLDYVFIFPLEMGMFGAVIATCIAPIISIMILLIHFISKKNSLKFCRSSVNVMRIKNNFSLGIPSLVTEISSGVVIIVFNMITMKIAGNVGVAAYGVIANISIVVISIYTGIAQGSQPLLSGCYGRGERQEMRAILRYAIIAMIGVSIIVYIIMLTFAEPVVGIFNSENDCMLSSIAVTGLKLYFIAVLFVGFNIIISVYFTSMEKALPAQAVSIIRGLILIVPMALLMSGIWGLTGTWLSFPATEAIVSIGAIIYLKIKD
ncbi:MAG: MATE family efflux transporter [Firmicutes bacterium]|jgi:putative MATE family efflux protein|nr:MATE family efflux transporter [Bacillota bacterium]